MTLPTNPEVADRVEELKSVVRRDPSEQRGSSNLTARQRRAVAARLVTGGRTMSCARELITAFGRGVVLPAAGRFALENRKGTESGENPSHQLLVIPLRVAGGSGSPVNSATVF